MSMLPKDNTGRPTYNVMTCPRTPKFHDNALRRENRATCRRCGDLSYICIGPIHTIYLGSVVTLILHVWVEFKMTEFCFLCPTLIFLTQITQFTFSSSKLQPFSEYSASLPHLVKDSPAFTPICNITRVRAIMYT